MTALRVGIDVSPLVQTGAGTHRHVSGLLAALEERPGLALRRYAFGGSGRAAALARDAAWYTAALPARASRDGVDVLHCPTFRAPVAARVPLVVTFHDLAVLRHPGTFNRWTRSYSRALLPRVARAARRILAVSAFTASEVVQLLGVPPGKVEVVPNGVGAPFAPRGERATGDYVLAVATLEPRKNLARLVQGFRRSRLARTCELRIAGAAGWGGVRVGGERVRWLGRVSDAELARLYRGARCAAYVSLYEGFGLPVLEAMACGTPAVAADVPALREVAGEAGVLVDGLSPEAIGAGLDEAAARRDELAAAGLERARRFTWEAAAAATHAVYREVARA